MTTEGQFTGATNYFPDYTCPECGGETEVRFDIREYHSTDPIVDEGDKTVKAKQAKENSRKFINKKMR